MALFGGLKSNLFIASRWKLHSCIMYLPKTKKFDCVRGETWLHFSFQKLRNRQKWGETCQVTWEIRRVLRVDRRTSKKEHQIVFLHIKLMLLHYFQQAWRGRSTRKTLLISHVIWQVSPGFCLFRNFWKKKCSRVSPPTQPNSLVFGKFHLFWLYEYLCLRIIIHRGPTHFARISKITTRQTRNVCKSGE